MCILPQINPPKGELYRLSGHHSVQKYCAYSFMKKWFWSNKIIFGSFVVCVNQIHYFPPWGEMTQLPPPLSPQYNYVPSPRNFNLILSQAMAFVQSKIYLDIDNWLMFNFDNLSKRIRQWTIN